MTRRHYSFWQLDKDRHGRLKGDSPFRFRLQRVRDGGSMPYLVSTLSSINFKYAGPLFNVASECAESNDYLAKLLKPTDLIVMATRPPLHDPQSKDKADGADSGESKKAIARTGWDIERVIFDLLELNFFDWCSRAKLDLKPHLAEKLPKDLRNRASLRFHAHGHADIVKMEGLCHGKARRKERNATAGFLIYVPHITPWIVPNRVGPALLAAFGMGGVETISFCSLLASMKRPALKQIVSRNSPTFLYAEFVVPRTSSDKPPATLSFASKMAVRAVLKTREAKH